MQFSVKGQVSEAYVQSGNISLIQGNTIENSILHHIREKGGISSGDLEKELFPVLPKLVSERLLQKFVSQGKLVEVDGGFKTPANWKPEDGGLPLPENSILKIQFFEAGDFRIVFSASLDEDRYKRPAQNTRNIPGSFSAPLSSRPGFSAFLEEVKVINENKIGEGAELVFDSEGARLVWKNKLIKNFGMAFFEEMLAHNLDFERKQTKVEVLSPNDDAFEEPELVQDVEVLGNKLPLNSPVRFQKVPVNESSAVNALLSLVRLRRPNEETYKAVVDHVWDKVAQKWGFEKETLFPNGFPSFSRFQSI